MLFRSLELMVRPSEKRDGLVIANILNQVLGITVKPVTTEFSVQIERFTAMDFQLRLGGSGGDYDPDDALVDWMMTDSKFNGRTRDTDEMPFGYFSEAEVDRLSVEQSTTADPDARRDLVQKANKITSDKVACGFLYHPVDVQVRHKSVNFPAESRIPGLNDLDRVTLS